MLNYNVRGLYMKTISKIIFTILLLAIFSTYNSCGEDEEPDIRSEYYKYISAAGWLDFVNDNVDEIRYMDKVVSVGKRWGGMAYVGRSPKVIDVSTASTDVYTSSTIVHEAAHHEQYNNEGHTNENCACTKQIEYLNDLIDAWDEYLVDAQGSIDAAHDYGEVARPDEYVYHGSFGVKLLSPSKTPLSNVKVSVNTVKGVYEDVSNTKGYVMFYYLPPVNENYYKITIYYNGQNSNYYIYNHSDNTYVLDSTISKNNTMKYFFKKVG